MQDRERSYLLGCMACLACAVGITLLVWARVPFPVEAWPGVVLFTLYATLAELLAVTTDEGQGVSVSPTSPILWAATCVMGPLPAIVVGVSFAVLTMAIRFGCYHLSPYLRNSAEHTNGSIGRWLSRNIRGIGSHWQNRGLALTLLYLVFYVSNNIIVVGPSGLVFDALGGRFLVEAAPTSIAHHFVLPFLGMVAVSIVAEHAVYVSFITAMDPLPAAKRTLYGLLLRVRLVLLEDVLPVWRGQVFLVAVALLLAYLYIHIGAWGFVLTAMPLLALRDFFRQWVEERAAYVNTITTLATYMQHYHPYTRGHLKRVADMSERLARELRLPAESIRHISTAGFLHDIGKIAVSEEILDKTSKLTDDEWAQIREHPVKGAEIISHIEFLEGIADWIRYHHKWYNGSGYPATNGEKVSIPIEAAIIATVDAFDAMTDDRELTVDWQCDTCGFRPDDGSRPRQCPKCGAEKRRTYREPKPLDEAIEELRRGAGTQFDPRVVKAFLTMVDRDGIRFYG